ncbi:Fic family protein [Patescibacteria group bacterium]|nr:Fic family protein [Patescibacteria group bacterium]MBU4000063.1 Fic family protein [Patescibacteria group bacterium]MBU4368899.1 Fic family protein [Patescibacteria group bacterium]
MNNESKLNKRQDKILDIVEKKRKAAVSEILADIKNYFGEISKITINRDLKRLLELNLITESGKGRAVVYELSPNYNLFKHINREKYFSVETDKRNAREKFNFEIFPILKDIFIPEEEKHLKGLNKEYRDNIKKISENLLKKEFERLVIELSWKSSQIEGNTYSLLETEFLIKEKKEAPGHKKEEAVMILNHKEALDYIIKNREIFKTFTVSKIEDIHRLLTNNLGILRGLRKRAVGITGTKYKPLNNEFQIREALEKTCLSVNAEENPFAKAVIAMILIAYIQPFEDGNKRTSRLTGNAILMAHDICPLSYRNMDEVEYKKAVILFYEQNNIGYFKKLFIEQFEFAVKNYFRI